MEPNCIAAQLPDQEQDQNNERCHECRCVAVEKHFVPLRIAILQDNVTGDVAVLVVLPETTWWGQPRLVGDSG